jgi:hypothetical protein
MFDASENYGNKRIEASDMSLQGANGLLRMKAFCEWSFKREEKAVIVAGHSIYFREFFKTFLARDSNHISKIEKVKNCGVVAFNLERVRTATGHCDYRIVEDSILPLREGFEDKKTKKKQ